jgi:hypothetical protein
MVTAGVLVAIVIAGLVIRNQVRVHRNRVKGEQERLAREAAAAALIQRRHALFDMLQPVALANCRLERFGETHDGGYLMCANLLDAVESGYSYGISGYDQWGCDTSRRFDITIHQYDCFDTNVPECRSGRTVFHAECVADRSKTEGGRAFDTIVNQIARNGDRAKRLVSASTNTKTLAFARCAEQSEDRRLPDGGSLGSRHPSRAPPVAQP